MSRFFDQAHERAARAEALDRHVARVVRGLCVVTVTGSAAFLVYAWSILGA